MTAHVAGPAAHGGRWIGKGDAEALQGDRMMGFSITHKGLMALSCLAVAGAVPALADVKDGVDAWTRGDFPAAVREWQPLAAKGDADAQFNLAQAYKLGRGVSQDLTRAEMLYAKAAAQGHLQAGDNYGLLLFQRGQHAAALPYIRASSERGEPRSLYLLGLAYFNADGVNKDWVRAYALESLAAQPILDGSGLPQAKAALGEMDKYVPLEDRQRAISLATDMAAQIEANRQRQLAAADLGTPNAPVSGPAPVRAPPARTPSVRASSIRAVPSGALQNGGAANGGMAVIATGMAGNVAEGGPLGREPAPRLAPRLAAPPPAPRPASAGLPPAPAPRLAPRAAAEPKALAPRPVVARPAPVGGPWKLQLGAFGVAGNADALWARVKSMPEIAGHPRANVPVGKVTRLLATGYSEEGAQAACRKLSGAGLICMAVKD